MNEKIFKACKITFGGILALILQLILFPKERHITIWQSVIVLLYMENVIIGGTK